MRPIGEFPTGCLAHLVSVERVSSSQRRVTYRLTAVPVPRPAAGSQTHRVACPVCGTAVTWTVFSAEIARRRRLTFRTLLTIGLVLGFGGLLLVVLALFGDSLPSAANPVAIMIVAVIGGFYLAFVGGKLLSVEDGVKVSDGNRLFKKHSVRFPPARAAQRTPQ